MNEQTKLEDTSSTNPNKFLVKLSETDVAKQIIENARLDEVSLLESATALAIELEIDFDQMASFINGTLKEMMQVECENTGLIRKDIVYFELE